MSGGYLNRALKAHADEIQQIYEDAVEDAMSGCNATLTVLANVDELTDRIETVSCTRSADEPHGSMSDERHRDCEAEIVRAVEWTDDAPGAKPHTPPRYRAYPMHLDVDGRPDAAHGGWLVQVADGWWWREVASFPPRHPNPEGAARSEADRLNREGVR